MNLSNVHDANFATALELGRRLGMAVPAAPACHLFAVEVVDNLTFDAAMSPELERAYPELAREILSEVLRLVYHGRAPRPRGPRLRAGVCFPVDPGTDSDRIDHRRYYERT
jgi:hypothetical protein